MNKQFLYGIDIAAPKNTYYSTLEVENKQVVKTSVLHHGADLTSLIAKISEDPGAVCIDAPLSWNDDSTTDSRGIEEMLRKIDGVKSNWVLSPNSLRGSVTGRGQRVARGLTQKGLEVFESHPRVLLSQILSESNHQHLAVNYKGKDLSVDEKLFSCQEILRILIMQFNLQEVWIPQVADKPILHDDQIDALVLGLVLFDRLKNGSELIDDYQNTGYGNFLLLGKNGCSEYQVENETA